MIDNIVQTSENVTLIGAGQVNKGILADAMDIAPYLIAADGGAQLAQKYGRTPKKIIGDMDSLTKDARARFPAGTLLHIEEQDTTDFDKCLQNISAPLIIGVGFLGKRLDHQLAALNTLAAHPHQDCILFGKRDVVFHLRSSIRLELDVGSRLSLVPMKPVAGVSSGLKWPIGGLNFSPTGRIGTSNLVVEPIVDLAMEGPGMLVILPRAALKSVVGGMRAVRGK